MKAAALLLSTVLAFPSLRDEKQNQTPAPEAYTSAEAYEIYSAILPSEWTYNNSQRLLIRAQTVTYEMCAGPNGPLKKLLEEAIADYSRVNRKTWKLQGRFNIAKPYELVTSEILEVPFKAAGFTGWSRFNSEHPGSAGWQEFSAVGFSRDKFVAIVYAAHHCGPLCGGGGFSALKKDDRLWVPMSWPGANCGWMN